jgi:hypothetical protein
MEKKCFKGFISLFIACCWYCHFPHVLYAQQKTIDRVKLPMRVITRLPGVSVVVKGATDWHCD